MTEVAAKQDQKGRFALEVIILIVLLNGLGWVSGYFGGSGNTPWFVALDKPPGQPPNWLFPIAWTTLYTLMAIAVAMVLRSSRTHAGGVGGALLLFAVQFVINLLYTPLFFGIESLWGGVIITGLLLFLLPIVISSFRKHSRAAGNLLVPYLAWVAFAFYLGVGLIMAN